MPMMSPSPPSPPPRAKSPLPMIPVPRALEMVLTEAARSLWLADGGRDGAPRRDAGGVLVGDGASLLGRTSAADVATPAPGYPDHNASIMDGYAVRTVDLAAAREARDAVMDPEEREGWALEFEVVGRVYAGDDDDEDDDDGRGEGEVGEVHPTVLDSGRRTAVYVTTGAVVPAPYDAVVPVEETAAIPPAQNNGAPRHRVRVLASKLESVLAYPPFKWIRPVGCDIPPGHVVLARGETIRPVHLALLAQVGVALHDVRVKRLPRVGVVSTGNELLAAASSPSSSDRPPRHRCAGKIPDANRPLLLAQLGGYGNCVPVDLGIVSDDAGIETISRRLDDALWNEADGVDVLVTTGGVSMGEKDVVERVLTEGMGGDVHFGRMNMKPGKPTTFVTVGRDTKRGRRQKLAFALPGNPVSASVCGELLVRPCLDLLHDGVDAAADAEDASAEAFVQRAVDGARVHEEVVATVTSDIKLDQGRPEYRRVALRRVPCAGGEAQQYKYLAAHTGVQRSSRVLSLRGADGLMMLPRGGPNGCGRDVAKEGEEFPVLLFQPLSASSTTRFEDSMHRGARPSDRGRGKRPRPKLKLGVLVYVSFEGDDDADDFRFVDATLVAELGGDGRAAVARRRVWRCAAPSSDDDGFVRELRALIDGPAMEGTDAIFVVVPSDPRAAGAIAFRAGLEVARALRPALTKHADAVALQARRGAAAREPAAALFENVVGVAREGSAVLITCSDRGLEGATSAIEGLLGHVTSLLNTDQTINKG